MKQLERDIEKYLQSKVVDKVRRKSDRELSLATDARAILRLMKKHGYKRNPFKVKIRERRK